MKSLSWFLTLAAWDGVLPLAFGCIALVLTVLFPHDDLAEIAAVILIPLFSALARAAIAGPQVAVVCHGEVPWSRQLLLGMGIILLLLFEIAAGVLISTRGEVPVGVWSFCLVAFLLYLFCLGTALRPA